METNKAFNSMYPSEQLFDKWLKEFKSKYTTINPSLQDAFTGGLLLGVMMMQKKVDTPM